MQLFGYILWLRCDFTIFYCYSSFKNRVIIVRSHHHRIFVYSEKVYIQYSEKGYIHRRQSGDWGSQPPDFGQKVVGGIKGVVGSWMGREILLGLYTVAYHVQKVCLKLKV